MQFQPTRTYSQLTKNLSLRDRTKGIVRDWTLKGLSLGRRIDQTNNWVRFIYYHHVFDDERIGFSNQLRHLKNFGEFVTLDAAIDLIESGNVIDGRYFCIAFDDGFKSCVSGSLPILVEFEIPCAYFIVTDMIGKILQPDDPRARNLFGFTATQTSLEFMTWKDCAKLVESGMTVGSHTCSHLRLSHADDAAVVDELSRSKSEIERLLGVRCDHFSAPFGVPGNDFDLIRHGRLAQATGFKSFATGKRGRMLEGSSPFAILRDHLLAGWGLHQLNYFLSLER